MRSWNIYHNKSKFKILIFIFAFVIGIVSVFYTQVLVNQLAARENKLINLYAKGLKNAVDAPNNETLTFLFKEIIEANNSIPVILTDVHFNPISERNVRIPKYIGKAEKQAYLRKEIEKMKAERVPIEVDLSPGLKNYIFYRNSFLLTQLLYYPYIQLSIIAILASLAYLIFSYSRNAEQNRVWVGLAKETAHQLGTPISSLMAWAELLHSDPKYQNEALVPELEKDIERLNMIASRFSSIGSVPALKREDMKDVIEGVVKYLKTRISKKVTITVQTEGDSFVLVNRALFEWVIENLCKNAVDAMNGKGKIDIRIHEMGNKLAIDITDTGKGIAKSKFKEVFNPGFTTKKRGWGLGLALVKRIVENYHSGKIFVLYSEADKGTTFRVLMKQ